MCLFARGSTSGHLTRACACVFCAALRQLQKHHGEDPCRSRSCARRRDRGRQAADAPCAHRGAGDARSGLGRSADDARRRGERLRRRAALPDVDARPPHPAPRRQPARLASPDRGAGARRPVESPSHHLERPHREGGVLKPSALATSSATRRRSSTRIFPTSPFFGLRWRPFTSTAASAARIC